MLDIISDIEASFSNKQKKRILCLSTTAKTNNPEIYRASPRETAEFLVETVIIKNPEYLYLMVDKFSPIAENIYIDCEKKDGLRLSDYIEKQPQNNNIQLIKPNDITVEALQAWIFDKIETDNIKHITVLGLGNIGRKIGVSMIERGISVTFYNRSNDRLLAFKKYIETFYGKQKSVKFTSDLKSAFEHSENIISCISDGPIQTQKFGNMKKLSFVLDVGNGSFDQNFIDVVLKMGAKIEVLSVLAAWEAFILRVNKTKEMRRTLGRRVIDSHLTFVSVGMLGQHGDVLVDNLWQPKKMFGVCDGKGDLIYDKAVLDVKIKAFEGYKS